MTITRRSFLGLSVTLPVIAAASSFANYSIKHSGRSMTFSLPDLPYARNELEPFISSKTLDYHYGKHHSTYVSNLNKLIENTNEVNMSLEDIIKNTYSDKTKVGVFNNAAQVWNHTFYWNSMKQNGGSQPEGALMKKIQEDFGNFNNFVSEFKTAGATQFGSGWAWLVLDNGKLKVIKTANAICPIVNGQIPLVTMDVWEHAYYLDFQNRRPDYIAMFLDKLVNWKFATDNFNQAIAISS